jgi:hypothetical protein
VEALTYLPFHILKNVDRDSFLTDTQSMNIQSASAGYDGHRIMEEAAVKTMSMALGTLREQGQAVAELLDSAAGASAAQTITDPALGGRVNLLA